MYQGAVFFDADGTLIDGPSGIIAPTEKTKEAIVRLRERNILTVLATGRSKCYVLPSLLLFDCYITANGARSSKWDSDPQPGPCAGGCAPLWHTSMRRGSTPS